MSKNQKYNMKKTIVDFPKIQQALDNGWKIKIFKNILGTYTAVARSTRSPLTIVTDDFTPEQALTRVAYKLHGEII